MDINTRFHKTDLGLYPIDWHQKSVEELSPYVTSGSRGWASYYSEYGEPFIRITNLTRGWIYLDLSDLRFVKLPSNSSEGLRTRLKENDILISITADIGIVGFVTKDIPQPSYINQHISLVRFDSDFVHPKFICYFMASSAVQKVFRAMTDAGAKAGMNLTTVKQIKFMLPSSKKEQEAIASALSDADAYIESLEKLIAKKRLLKKGVMQSVLLKKEENSSWITVALDKVATVSKGAQPSKELYSDNQMFPFLNGGISPSGLVNRWNKDKNTIAISEGGNSCGYVQLMSEKFWCGGHCYSVTPNDIDNLFLYHILKANESEIMGMRVGSGLPNIQKKNLLNFKIQIVTSINEQKRIAEILTDIDCDILIHENRLQKMRLIKQGMMQELLTGRIRLV